MKRTRFVKTILKILIKDRMQYPGRLFADTMAIVARCGVLLVLYAYVFKLNNGSINGVSFVAVAWSIFFYFALSLFGLRGITRRIMTDVTSGHIEVILSKPVNYLLYRAWWQVGGGVYPFLTVTTVGLVALIIMVGVPETMLSWFFVSTFFVTLIGAIVLTLLVYMSIGLFSFWIEDINPIFWVVDKAVMILGGSYLPVALFPGLMYKIALYSPFGASVFVSHTVYESWSATWFLLLSIQGAWILTLGMFVYFMFSLATKKVFVNGG